MSLKEIIVPDIGDFDSVDLSNLQRQIIHTTQDIGKPKVDSARDSLLALNPQIKVTPLYQQLDEESLTKQREIAENKLFLSFFYNMEPTVKCFGL